jgi:hypothetical protein
MDDPIGQLEQLGEDAGSLIGTGQPENVGKSSSLGEADEGGDVLVVREDFVPGETSGLPDDNLTVDTLDSSAGPPSNVLVADAPPDGFTDLGRVGAVPVGGVQTEDDESPPQAFINGGQSGTVAWAGGGKKGGPHGNQAPGSMQKCVAPTYEARFNKATNDADAWVRPGTGAIDVVRSWLGANPGDQGNGFFVTPQAAARLNDHETQHVASSNNIYAAQIDPLLARVADHSPGLGVASSREAAIDALKAAIHWPESTNAFQQGDKLANSSDPLGIVDTIDLKASGTYPENIGSGVVGGKFFQSRLKVPSEPDPV